MDHCRAGPQDGQHLDVHLRAPVALRSFPITFVADELHSVPRRLRLYADGRLVGRASVPSVQGGAGLRSTTTAQMSVAPVSARRLRLVMDAVQRPGAQGGDERLASNLPVAISDVGLAGVSSPRAPADAAERLPERSPGRRRVTAAGPDQRGDGGARTGLSISLCADGALTMGKGRHHLLAAVGLRTGIDLDRLILSSGSDGRAATGWSARRPAADVGRSATVRSSKPTSLTVQVRTDGKPFWLVLGQSDNAGWKAQPILRIGRVPPTGGRLRQWMARAPVSDRAP